MGICLISSRENLPITESAKRIIAVAAITSGLVETIAMRMTTTRKIIFVSAFILWNTPSIRLYCKISAISVHLRMSSTILPSAILIILCA